MKYTITDKLDEGDCFLYLSPDAMEAETQRLEEWNRLHGDEEDLNKQLLELAALNHLRIFAEPHIIDVVVLATGDRVSKRVTDGKRFIWYRGNTTQVEVVDARDDFEKRLVEMHKARKKFEQELAKAQKKRKSKKMKKEELEERTVVAQQ